MLSAHPVPGLVAVVTDEDGIVAEGAAGVRVLGRPDPIRVDDLFHIGSITKPMTATLAAELVDAGKLGWDSTLAEMLPALAEGMREEYRAVTLTQLLSMEGGIQPFTDDSDPEFQSLPKLEGDARTQRRELTRYALSLPPASPPGTEFLYSNASYAIVGTILEEATGRSWEDLMRERLFAPLGMKSAGFGWPNDRSPQAPWGHAEKGGELVPVPPGKDYQMPPWIAPAGNVSMSLPDLARFARLHLRGFDGRDKLLLPETFRKMHARRLHSGLGWGVSELLGHNPVSTFSGSAGSFYVIVVLVHDSDLGFVVGANSGDGSPAAAATREAFKELLVRFAGDHTPPKAPDKAPSSVPPPTTGEARPQSSR